MPPLDRQTILGLDVGDNRIGIASANIIARIASPLSTISNDQAVTEALKKICHQEGVSLIVVGLPRDLNGRETAQTRSVRQFADRLKSAIDLPIEFQDEAVTSKLAEAELNKRQKAYKKSDIDALAATYILDDYLQQTGVSQ